LALLISGTLETIFNKKMNKPQTHISLVSLDLDLITTGD